MKDLDFNIHNEKSTKISYLFGIQLAIYTLQWIPLHGSNSQ